jgi:biopolymer transport protein ExbB/TolQ
MAKQAQRLTRKDKSNAEVFENSAATKVSGLLTFGIAIAMTVCFYILIIPFKDIYFGQLFYERGFVQYVLVFLASWALAILFIKSRKIKIQKEVMHYKLLPDDIAYEIDGENMEEFEDHIWRLDIRHNESFLVTRILRGLSHFYVRRKHSDVREIMTAQSEIDFQSVESSYSIIKVFIWAIPIFGFVGTVMGISDAIGSFSSALNGAEDVAVLKDSLGSVTSGLGVAFDTTFLALLLSLVLMFPTTMMQTAEEDFLVSVDEYCNEHFLKRLNADGAGSEGQFSTEEVANAVQMVLAGSQGVFVQKIGTLQDQLVDLHNNQVEVVNHVNDLTNNQIENLKTVETNSRDNTQMMKEAFDEIVENLTNVSDLLSGNVVKNKKKGWLW